MNFWLRPWWRPQQHVQKISWSLHVVFKIFKRTDRHTDTLIAILRTLPWGEVNVATVGDFSNGIAVRQRSENFCMRPARVRRVRPTPNGVNGDGLPVESRWQVSSPTGHLALHDPSSGLATRHMDHTIVDTGSSAWSTTSWDRSVDATDDVNGNIIFTNRDFTLHKQR